jgi:hypothetical protein
MKKILGYIISTIGLIAFVFFLKYNGTAIPSKELWFVLSFIVTVMGFYLIVKDRLRKEPFYSTTNNRINQINNLKLTGDKVRVNLGNSEVKSRTFQQEVINDRIPTDMEMIDALYDSNRSYKTDEIQQTYIVFYKQYGNKTYKFISHATMQSPELLKGYMYDQNGIDLYVDKENPNNYYFDFSF